MTWGYFYKSSMEVQSIAEKENLTSLILMGLTRSKFEQGLLVYHPYM